MFLGDREVGKGAPVDQLDKACRSLKQCHKCAQGKFLFAKILMSLVNYIPVAWYASQAGIFRCFPRTFTQVGGLRFITLKIFLDQHSTADCATEYVLNRNKNGYESWTDGGQRCANDMFNCDNQFISSLFELKAWFQQISLDLRLIQALQTVHMISYEPRRSRKSVKP